MLAEIFLMRLQFLLRSSAANGWLAPARDPRFVPVILPHR
jgi:hypothetical protein